MSFLKYKIAISPVGFGEMCFRHFELMQLGRCGIVQDLSHVEHYTPLKNGENVLFYSLYFSDIINIIKSIDEGGIEADRVGRQALKDAANWAQDIDMVLYKSLIQPLEMG